VVVNAESIAGSRHLFKNSRTEAIERAKVPGDPSEVGGTGYSTHRLQKQRQRAGHAPPASAHTIIKEASRALSNTGPSTTPAGNESRTA